MGSTVGRDNADGDLKPDDVASATFSTSFRGFDPGEVRAYLSRIAGELRSAQRQLRAATDQLQAVENQRGDDVELETPAVSDLAEQQRMSEVLGAEAARVLATAHDAGADIRARAESDADEIRAAAQEEATTTRETAEAEASEIVASADRLLVERSEEAEASASAIVAQAEVEREEMRQEGRHMVSEARIVRQRILKDMAKRRNQGRVQLEQLRAGRDRLQDSYGLVRRTLEEVTVELANVVDDARIAADRAGRNVDVDDVPSMELLESEVAVARDAGLTVPPPEPRLDGESTNEFDRRLLAEAAQETIDGDTTLDDSDSDAFERPDDATLGDDAPKTEVVVGTDDVVMAQVEGVATGDVFGSETPEDGVDFRPEVDADGRVFEGVRILGPAIRPAPETVTTVVRADDDVSDPSSDGADSSDGDDPDLDEPPTWRDAADEEAATDVTDVDPKSGEADDVIEQESEVGDADVASEVDAAGDAGAVGDTDTDEGEVVQPDVAEVDDLAEIDTDSAGADGEADAISEADDGAPAAVLDLVDEPVIDLRDSVVDGFSEPAADATNDAADSGADADATDDDTAVGADAAEPEQNIDSLFARLKESSSERDDDTDGDAATDVVAPPIPHHVARVDQPPLDESADEQSSADATDSIAGAVTTPVAEASDPEAPAAEASDVAASGSDDEEHEGAVGHEERVMIARRDAMVDVAVRDLARHLKRLLSDDQNELLELLRASPNIKPTDLVGESRADRMDERAHAELVVAFSSGAAYARPTATAPDASVSDLSRAVADHIDQFLNDRLARAVEETAGDSAELAERVRGTYREVRTREITRAAEHGVLSAFARGGRAVAGPEDALRWVANSCGPDCLDNSLAGNISSSDQFPTGHAAPPAHQGCRCLLVVVEHE